MENKFQCKICNKLFDKKNSLSHHIYSYHKIKVKDYYDKYLKKQNEGICKYCKKPTKYIGWGYSGTCGNRTTCANKKREDTNLKKYGDKNPWKFGGDLFKQRMIEKYGVDNSGNNSKSIEKRKETYKNKSKEEKQKIKDKRKQTCLKKWGVKNTFQNENCKKKAKETKLKKYGNEKYNNSEKGKQTRIKNCGSLDESYKKQVQKAQKTNIKKWGCVCTLHNEKIEKQIFKTRIKNGTMSKDENNFYKELCKIFKKSDIKRQYKDKNRYPFNCDFYIKSLDLFIELNLTWTHGGHLFNKNSKEDQKTLQKWQSKARNSDFYKNAIETWTKRDLSKFNVAKKNKLNYVILYNKKDINNFINL